MTDSPGTDHGSDPPDSRSKVKRVIDEYDLNGLGEELARRWRGEPGDRTSLRELESVFNKRVLESALERADGRVIDGEVENLYRLLTDDDVSASARTEAETKLDRLGLDVEALRAAFVSHQAVHTYLTTVQGASAPGRDDSTDAVLDRRRQSIQRLRSRLGTVTEESIEALEAAGHLSGGSFDTVVSVTVNCRGCGSTYDVVELLERGACDCPS